MNRFRLIFQNIKEHIIYDSFIEEIFLDLVILQSVFYLLHDFLFFRSGFFQRDYGFGLAFLLTGIIVLIKFFKWRESNKFFTLLLLLEAVRYPLFFLMGLLNLFLGLIFFYSLTYPANYTWSFGIFFRCILIGEKLIIQNRLLRDAIDDTATLGNPECKSPLAGETTAEAIAALTGIRENYVEAMEERMRSEKMKTELITNISHDLKTPLTSIINYADILSKKETMDSEAENYIRILGRNSQRLKSLIVDLIDASKTGTGNVHIERGFLDFNELVSQIYGDFDSNYKEKNLEFIYESGEDSIVLYSDGNLLSRTIQNLISNACKYSQLNTRVYAKTEETEDAIYFSIKNVSEQPLNMTAEELMEQFIRGEKSRYTDGSGLGLYIAKNLIELLGGECRIVIDGDFFQVFLEIPKDMESK